LSTKMHLNSQKFERNTQIQTLYALTAPYYEKYIHPAVTPLAVDLARWIVRCCSENEAGSLYDPFDTAENTAGTLPLTALDIGTGSGLVASELAPFVKASIGVDISPAMLARARHPWLLQADLHALPFPRRSFDLLVASFGLNTSEPRPAFKSLARLLRPGGLLIYQEWGALDPCSACVDATFDAHLPDPAFGLPETLRSFLEAPKPWYDHLQDAEDHYEMLKSLGFDRVWVREAPFVSVRFDSPSVFLDYKLAWASRRLALNALPPETRDEILAALAAALAPLAEADGSLRWSPPLIRVCAQRA